RLKARHRQWPRRPGLHRHPRRRASRAASRPGPSSRRRHWKARCRCEPSASLAPFLPPRKSRIIGRPRIKTIRLPDQRMPSPSPPKPQPPRSRRLRIVPALLHLNPCPLLSRLSHTMAAVSFDDFEKALADHGPAAAIDQLCAELRQRKDYASLFYALLMKKRQELEP